MRNSLKDSYNFKLKISAPRNRATRKHTCMLLDVIKTCKIKVSGDITFIVPQSFPIVPP